MRYILYLLSVVLFGHSISQGQSVQNVKATFQEGKAIITYDIAGGQPGQLYTMRLYGSHNNFASALTKVSGDVGDNITPGVEKKIIWDASAELVDFKGDINFRITGEVMPVPFVFKSPAANATIKRGKKTTITWEGGKENQPITLALYRGAEQVSIVAETTNTGQFTWSVPRKQSKGTYSLMLNPGQQPVSSNAFKIKSKTSFIIKALPVAVVGGALVFLLGGSSGSNNDLPEAPDPQSK